MFILNQEQLIVAINILIVYFAWDADASGPRGLFNFYNIRCNFVMVFVSLYVSLLNGFVNML